MASHCASVLIFALLCANSAAHQIDGECANGEEACGINLLQTMLEVDKAHGGELSSAQDRVLAQPVRKSVHTHANQKVQTSARKRYDINNVICPYLSTLINEGVLAVKDSYTKEELREITIQAGLAEATADHHMEEVFKHIPEGVQDLFNMEGAGDEHATSTGINDCPTTFTDCTNSTGTWRCTNSTESCTVPNEDVFNTFFALADTNTDEVLTLAEVNVAVEDDALFEVDASPITDITIQGALELLMNVFGTPQNEAASLTKADLKSIFIDRVLPTSYTAFDCWPVLGDAYYKLADSEITLLYEDTEAEGLAACKALAVAAGIDYFSFVSIQTSKQGCRIANSNDAIELAYAEYGRSWQSYGPRTRTASSSC